MSTCASPSAAEMRLFLVKNEKRHDAVQKWDDRLEQRLRLHPPPWQLEQLVRHYFYEDEKRNLLLLYFLSNISEDVLDLLISSYLILSYLIFSSLSLILS